VGEEAQDFPDPSSFLFVAILWRESQGWGWSGIVIGPTPLVVPFSLTVAGNLTGTAFADFLGRAGAGPERPRPDSLAALAFGGCSYRCVQVIFRRRPVNLDLSPRGMTFIPDASQMKRVEVLRCVSNRVLIGVSLLLVWRWGSFCPGSGAGLNLELGSGYRWIGFRYVRTGVGSAKANAPCVRNPRVLEALTGWASTARASNCLMSEMGPARNPKHTIVPDWTGGLMPGGPGRPLFGRELLRQNRAKLGLNKLHQAIAIGISSEPASRTIPPGFAGAGHRYFPSRCRERRRHSRLFVGARNGLASKGSPSKRLGDQSPLESTPYRCVRPLSEAEFNREPRSIGGAGALCVTVRMRQQLRARRFPQED